MMDRTLTPQRTTAPPIAAPVIGRPLTRPVTARPPTHSAPSVAVHPITPSEPKSLMGPVALTAVVVLVSFLMDAATAGVGIVLNVPVFGLLIWYWSKFLAPEPAQPTQGQTPFQGVFKAENPAAALSHQAGAEIAMPVIQPRVATKSAFARKG